MGINNNLEAITTQGDGLAVNNFNAGNIKMMNNTGNCISIGSGNKICGSCKYIYPSNPHIIDRGLCDDCGMGSYDC